MSLSAVFDIIITKDGEVLTWLEWKRRREARKGETVVEERE